jgi:hypothetical protein
MLGRSALLASANKNAPPIVTSSLVLNLDAGKTASYPGTGSTWTDLSGSNKNGTLVDSPLYSGFFGGDFTFNGSTNYVNTAFTYADSSDFTMDCWIRPTTSATGQKSGVIGIRSSDTVPTNSHSSQIYISGDINSSTTGKYIVFRNYSNTINRSVIANTVEVTDGNWRHVTVTSGASVSKIYINAVLVATSSPVTSPPTRGAANFIVGAAGNWTSSLNLSSPPLAGYYYSGQLSSTSFYSRELTAAEIAQNFSALRRRYNA